MRNKFKNKTAIVTGGASGIGRALCEELARRGAIVAVADINQLEAERVALGIRADGGQAQGYFIDVTKEAEIRDLIENVVNTYGRLDYMFNNAGIAVLGECRDTNCDQWRRIVEVNQMGVIYGTLSAYEQMTTQGFGHIVNTSSYAGLLGYPLCVPYATTKHAIVGLSTSLRLEAAGLGVKVSVICPGPIRTNITNAAETMKTRAVADPFAKFPLTMGVEKAVKIILRKVAQNQAIIVFPFHARLTWWLSRVHPFLVVPGWRLSVKAFRKFVREGKA